MTASEYIYEKCPGRAPTDAETRMVIAWCDEWARDTFGDDDVDALDHDDENIADVRLLRACHRHLDGGLEHALTDCRRVMAETETMSDKTYALMRRAGI